MSADSRSCLRTHIVPADRDIDLDTLEKLGDHSLFSAADQVDLKAAMEELSNYPGTVWTVIYSLRREDAAWLLYPMGIRVAASAAASSWSAACPGVTSWTITRSGRMYSRLDEPEETGIQERGE